MLAISDEDQQYWLYDLGSKVKAALHTQVTWKVKFKLKGEVRQKKIIGPKFLSDPN